MVVKGSQCVNVGITLFVISKFGPRKKMTNAIARWHSNAPLSGNGLEQAYADKLETEMQEMAIRLHQV